MEVPQLVREARERAVAAGFSLASDDAVGRLLALLAAAVPPAGRILELGTGPGVGLAWLVSGFEGRDDVEVVTVEIDPATAAVARDGDWPDGVTLIEGDALDVLRTSDGGFDLVFADAQGGKTEGIELSIAALRPRGLLVLDDMDSLALGDPYYDELYDLIQAAGDTVMNHPALIAQRLDWATGVILAVPNHLTCSTAPVESGRKRLDSRCAATGCTARTSAPRRSLALVRRRRAGVRLSLSGSPIFATSRG